MFWRNNARSCSRTSETWRIHAGVRTSTWSGNAGEKVKILIKWSFPAWGELDELMCWLNYMQQNTTEKLESRRVKHVTSSSEETTSPTKCVRSNWQKHHYISLYILYIHVFHLVSIAVCLTCSLVTSAPHSFSQCSSGLMLLTAHRHEHLQVFWSFSKIFELNLVLNVFKLNIRLCELYRTCHTSTEADSTSEWM